MCSLPSWSLKLRSIFFLLCRPFAVQFILTLVFLLGYFRSLFNGLLCLQRSLKNFPSIFHIVSRIIFLNIKTYNDSATLTESSLDIRLWSSTLAYHLLHTRSKPGHWQFVGCATCTACLYHAFLVSAYIRSE